MSIAIRVLKNLKSYAMDMVREGKKEFCQLDIDEKEKMTGLIMNNTPIIHLWDYISEADHKNDIPQLLSKYLETGNEEFGLEILEKLKQNAVNFASNEIIKTLNDQSAEYDYEVDYEMKITKGEGYDSFKFDV